MRKFAALCMLVGLFATTGALPVTAAPLTVQVNAYANINPDPNNPADSIETAWTNTGLTLSAGLQVTITGAGTANRGSGDTDPDGLVGFACPSYCAGPGLPIASLIGRIGAGPPFLVGAGPITVSGVGTLYLAFNDGWYQDNSGSFTATIVANQSPQVAVTGVADGATYAIGHVPAAACAVVDAEDGTTSVSPQLGAITGPLSADGLGSQTATCTYTDGGGITRSATATYTIAAATVNAAPVAANDAYNTTADSALIVAAPGVLGNDTDAANDPLRAELVAGPLHGTLALNANGAFSYTPAANYSGPDSFTYRANDGATDSNVATVTLTVRAASQVIVTASAPSNGGTVNPAGATGYAPGSVARYTATANAGQVFLGWTLDDRDVGFASPLTFTVNGDRTLVARFAARPVFADVAPGGVAWEAITQLAARGIVKGYGDGTFGPADTVVRAQIAVLIVRAFGWDTARPNGPAPFADLGGIDPELQRAIAILAQRGIITGDGDGTFGPADEVKQAQVLSFIARSMVQAGYWTAVTQDDPAIYPDVPLASGHRLDLLTFVKYAGALPDRPTGQGWADWQANAPRGWAAQALWQALGSAFGVDRVP